MARFAATGVAAAPLQELTTQPSRKDLFKLVIADSKSSTAPSDSAREIFSLYGPFAFGTDAIFDVKEKKPREDAIFGIDLSHYTPDDFPIGLGNCRVGRKCTGAPIIFLVQATMGRNRLRPSLALCNRTAVCLPLTLRRSWTWSRTRKRPMAPIAGRRSRRSRSSPPPRPG
jgi:hypothetical protein